MLTELNMEARKKKQTHLCTLDKHCGVVCFLLNSSSELLILFVLQREAAFILRKTPLKLSFGEGQLRNSLGFLEVIFLCFLFIFFILAG